MQQKNKKGAISIDFIIGTILVTLGFALALILYFNLGGTGTLDRDVCHQSVILRASMPALIETFVPLKCRTEKICITSGLLGDILGSKECKDFIGEKGITYMKVKSIIDIEKVYADEILKCWEMMGEGKISFFNQYVAQHYGFGGVYPMCSICSRIAFNDKTITEDNFDFSRMDVSRYMMTHKIRGKEMTYFEYMASENGKIAVKENLFETSATIPKLEVKTVTNTDASGKTSESSTLAVSTTPGTTEVKSEDISSDISKEAIDLQTQLKESAVVFMQISSPKHGESFTNSLKAIAGVELLSFIIAPSLTLKANRAVITQCTEGWVACTFLAIIGIAYQQINVAYNRAVTAGYCGDLNVGSEARDGCSAVRTVSYNLEDISSYCKVIESTP